MGYPTLLALCRFVKPGILPRSFYVEIPSHQHDVRVSPRHSTDNATYSDVVRALSSHRDHMSINSLHSTKCNPSAQKSLHATVNHYHHHQYQQVRHYCPGYNITILFDYSMFVSLSGNTNQVHQVKPFARKSWPWRPRRSKSQQTQMQEALRQNHSDEAPPRYIGTMRAE